MKHITVYAKCSASGRIYLQATFTGTRSECAAYIKNRVRQGWLPTSCLCRASA